jgi:hypothetical protein
MNGLLRYNQIQKALSTYRKQQGWTLHGSRFQEIASDVYQSTKKEPLKQVINNFDIFVENLKGKRTPQLPSELTDWNFYFEFDGAVAGLPADIMVSCPQLFEDKYPVNSSILSYEDHFKPFSDYVNINRKYVPSEEYGTSFRFTEPEYDWNEQKWLTKLEISNLLGYEPGMEAFDNQEEVMEADYEYEVEAPEEEPEIVEEPKKKGKKGKAEKPEPKKKVEKEDREIRKIQAETEKIKASEKKISELNKGIKNLDSMLKRKLITKKEYKTYLNKLMGM